MPKPYDGLPTETTVSEALTDANREWTTPHSDPLRPDADEGRVAQAVKTRAIIEREIVRVVKRHMAAVAELDDWLAAETSWLKDYLTEIDAQIAAWHRRAHAEGKAGLEVRFPYGKLKLGPESRASLDVTDEDALVEWCETHMPEVVRTVTTKSVPKNEFKARVAPPKGDTSPVMPAVTEDGERVPGVQFKIPERTWKVTR